ncbi:MAG: TlpA family protein disulfide reductase [Ferrimicrobium sp.]
MGTTALEERTPQLRRGPRRTIVFVVVTTLAIVVLYAVYAATLASKSSSATSSALTTSTHSALDGHVVPVFSLPSVGGGASAVSPAEFAGKPLVINFFASWCIPCNVETPMIAREAKKLGSTVAFEGVDENDVQSKVLAFMRAKGVTYPVAFDPKATLQSSYLLIGLPTTVFVDRVGTVVGVVQGQLSQQALDYWLAKIEAR